MKQVMVVDNHPVMLKFMSDQLEKKGYLVTTAADGLSALETLKAFIPEVIFIDLVMPNITGEKVCQIIRSRRELKDCFIVVLSAIMAEEAPSFETCNADVFLAKCPFNQLSQYVDTIMQHLEQGRAESLKGRILGAEQLFKREITMELLDSKKQYEATLNHMSEGLVELVAESTVVFANPAALDILDRPEEDLLSAEFAGLFAQADQDKICRHIAEALASGSQSEPDDPVEFNDKRINLKIIPVADENTRTSVLIILRDVTLEKQLEAQLQRAKKMEAVGTLAGGVAHDLNNVLSAIVTYPDLILPQLPEDSPIRRPVLTMRESGNKAVAIVQDLLTLARRGVPTKMIVDVNRIITEFFKSPEYRKIQSYHPGVSVETRLEDDMPALTGSPVHLSKALMNLISNAVEAIEDTGKVEISNQTAYLDQPVHGYETVPRGTYVRIGVSDTGAGIAPPDMEHIFEPFYTKKKMGRSGTGLGMSVVWGTVKDHDGYIDIQSTEAKGTTIALYFPVSSRDPEPEKSAAPKAAVKGKGQFVLVVDDVREQREITSAILSSLGYSVDTVPGGEAAVSYIQEKQADLLILDMIMDPGIDGLETYKRILEIRPDQKAIVVSGYSETPRIQKIQELGAVEFLRKPYTMKSLGETIAKLLSDHGEET
ncbi:MAG: response regulator [Desulfobacterales bacterium]|nr:response regulator [Desulfobacterales bacterium]